MATETDEQQRIRQEFDELVNMTPKELENRRQTDESGLDLARQLMARRRERHLTQKQLAERSDLLRPPEGPSGVEV